VPRRIRRLAALSTLVISSGVIAAIAAIGAGGVGAAQAAALKLPQVGGAIIKDSNQAALRALTGRNGVESENWSGYAVTPTGGNVTGVSSTFVVPAAGDDLPGEASTWAGIGGYSSSDLIQAGVAESSFPNLPLLGDQYYAWYELLPASPVQLTGCNGDASCTVTPGDQIAVTITQNTNPANSWTISMTDAGKWTWTDDNISYTSTNSSAEWILESPTLEVSPITLAGVGTVHFGPYSSFTIGHGSPKSIAEGNPISIGMTLLGLGILQEATPSALASDGQGFNDCAYASSCAAPTS
jgi:hypothetical protein